MKELQNNLSVSELIELLQSTYLENPLHIESYGIQLYSIQLKVNHLMIPSFEKKNWTIISVDEQKNFYIKDSDNNKESINYNDLDKSNSMNLDYDKQIFYSDQNLLNFYTDLIAQHYYSLLLKKQWKCLNLAVDMKMYPPSHFISEEKAEDILKNIKDDTAFKHILLTCNLREFDYEDYYWKEVLISKEDLEDILKPLNIGKFEKLIDLNKEITFSTNFAAETFSTELLYERLRESQTYIFDSLMEKEVVIKNAIFYIKNNLFENKIES